jgi:hypothetical protein
MKSRVWQNVHVMPAVYAVAEEPAAVNGTVAGGL